MTAYVEYCVSYVQGDCHGAGQHVLDKVVSAMEDLSGLRKQIAAPPTACQDSKSPLHEDVSLLSASN